MNLYFIRHAKPVILEGKPAAYWPLSDEGRASCAPFAEQLRSRGIQRIYTSREPKAAETGELIARVLKLPFQTAINLHEHIRTNVPFYGREQFHEVVQTFFDKPDQLIFGDETADQAYDRFSAAVNTLINAHPGETLGIVTHGTVMTLFLSRRVGFAPFPFWQLTKMPDVYGLSLTDSRLLP